LASPLNFLMNILESLGSFTLLYTLMEDEDDFLAVLVDLLAVLVDLLEVLTVLNQERYDLDVLTLV